MGEESIKDTTRNDARVMRKVLQRELETINAYEDLLDELASPELRAVLAHIRDEEKEHVAETLHFIRQLDPAQEAVFQRSLADMLADVRPAGVEGPGAQTLTVGSLRSRSG